MKFVIWRIISKTCLTNGIQGSEDGRILYSRAIPPSIVKLVFAFEETVASAHGNTFHVIIVHLAQTDLPHGKSFGCLTTIELGVGTNTPVEEEFADGKLVNA